MGDPYQDHRALVEEYCRGVFGRAGEAMLEFFDVLYTNREERFPFHMHHHKWPGWLSTSDLYLLLYPPETLGRLEEALTKAEKLADTDRARGWVKQSREYFDFARLLTGAISTYRKYQRNKTDETWLELKKRVAAFDEYRARIVGYDKEYADRWFPGHGHFCNWLTGDTQHESKVYYTLWDKRKPEVLRKGVKGMAIGYGGGLADVAGGYSFVREPLTLDFDKPRP